MFWKNNIAWALLPLLAAVSCQESERPLVEEVRALVAESNGSHVEAVILDSPLFQGVDSPLTVVLTIKPDAVFRFERSEYTMQLGPQEVASIDWCSQVEKKAREQGEIPDLTIQGSASVGVASVSVGGEVRSWLKSLGNIARTRADIYVRGYADGAGQEWVQPWPGSPYKFESVTFHPFAPGQRERLNPRIHSKSTEVKKFAGNTYGNADLPLLRAAFVVDEFIDSVLQEASLENCRGIDVSVGILEGYELKGTDPSWRQVQVFIQLE